MREVVHGGKELGKPFKRKRKKLEQNALERSLSAPPSVHHLQFIIISESSDHLQLEVGSLMHIGKYSHLVVWLLFHFLAISLISSLSCLSMSAGRGMVSTLVSSTNVSMTLCSASSLAFSSTEAHVRSKFKRSGLSTTCWIPLGQPSKPSHAILGPSPSPSGRTGRWCAPATA